jgi:hypothetical protein
MVRPREHEQVRRGPAAGRPAEDKRARRARELVVEVCRGRVRADVLVEQRLVRGLVDLRDPQHTVVRGRRLQQTRGRRERRHLEGDRRERVNEVCSRAADDSELGAGRRNWWAMSV